MSGSLSHPEPANTFSLWTPTCPLHRGRTPGGSDLKIRSAALGKTHPHSQAFLIYHPNVEWALQTTQASTDCEQNWTQCEFVVTLSAALDSLASCKMSLRTHTQPPRRSITLQYEQAETFPFGNRIRQSQLMYNREMSNWARSILIGYTNLAFAFSNWYVPPDPESLEINFLKIPLRLREVIVTF